MDHFNSDLDLIFTLAALVPLAVAVAAWALQMACGFCSVEPPEFWKAVVTVVVIAVTNVVLRFFLQMTDSAHGMAPQYLLPGVATACVICICLPTGPFSAATITIVQVVLCSLVYYALQWLAALIILPFSV